MTVRIPAECGTPAALARHRRRNEPIDAICRAGDAARRRGEKTTTAGDITVTIRRNNTVVVTFADPLDARITAAAILDRAEALRLAPNREGKSTDEARTRTIYKRIITPLRDKGLTR